MTVVRANQLQTIKVAPVDAPFRYRMSAEPYFRLTGVNDDVKILTALQTGHVDLGPGTVTMGSQLAAIGQSHRKILGDGVDSTYIVSPNVADAVPGIRLRGIRTLIGSAAANIAKGAYQFTMTGDFTAVLAAGDLIHLASDDVFNPKRALQTTGEPAYVKSVAYSNPTTTVTMRRATRYAYTTANTIRVLKESPLVGLEMGGFTIVPHASNSTRASLIRAEELVDPYFHDIIMDGSNGSGGPKEGLVLWHAHGGTIERVYGRNIYDKNRGGSTATGYALFLMGSEFVTIRKCHCKYNRHSFEEGIDNLTQTVTVSGTPSQVAYGRIVNYKIKSQDNIAENDTASGFSSHGQSDACTSQDDTTINCGGGWAIRGSGYNLVRPKLKGINLQSPFLDNTTFDTYARPVWVGEVVQQGGSGSDFAGIAGTGLRIEAPEFDCENSTRYAEGTTASGNQTMHMIECYEPLIDAYIDLGTMKGATGHGLWLRGEGNQRSRIVGGKMEFVAGTVFSSSIPIYLDTPSGNGFAPKDVIIRDVEVVGARNSVVTMKGGNNTGANAASGIVIDNVHNLSPHASNTNKSLLELSGSTYVTDVHVLNTQNPSTTQANAIVPGTAILAQPIDKRGNQYSDSFDYVTPPLVVRMLEPYTTTTQPVAGVAELRGAQIRTRMDLSNFQQARLVTRGTGTGTASVGLRVQYSTDDSTFNYIDGSTGLEVTGFNSSGEKKSAWTNLAAGAKADVILRLATINGDGATQLSVGSTYLELR